MAASNSGSKKLLENPYIGNFIIPIAIVLVAALLIFGVSQILSTERGHKDLVREMRSKTFGNRWIAAYELSKMMATSQIPAEDTPWLIENLTDLYRTGQDLRTKKFIVIALGSLRTQESVNFLTQVLKEKESELFFPALSAIGNSPKSLNIPAEVIMGFLDSPDQVLVQAAILSLATHEVEQAQSKLVGFLSSTTRALKVSAALGLLNFKNEEAIPAIRELLTNESGVRGESWTRERINAVKINILDSIGRKRWDVFGPEIEAMAQNRDELKLAAKALEVLNILKNKAIQNNN